MLASNLQLSFGEIDLVARDALGTLWVVEVRGRQYGQPWQFLSFAKKRKLQQYQRWLSARTGESVGIYFVEVQGQWKPPRGPRRLWYFLASRWPESFGLRVNGYSISDISSF